MHKINLFILSLLLVPTLSFADGYLRLGGMYLSSTEGYDGGGDTKTTRTLMDLGAGYIWPAGWTVGGLYSTETIKSGGLSMERKSMGPTVGWISQKQSGFYVLATYILKAEKDPEFEGTGYQGDFGYKFNIGRLSFAPQLTYRHLNFDKYAGNTLNPKYTETKIDPYFVLWFEF